ncbi:MAG: hypothetical protein RLO51_22425 [Thalassobaculum sp.]|uniref:hypothetical protein n=1 Tax=Thalassobaculum sp. TaxID=2022740 RepID=UPI0032EC9DF3
MVPPILGLGDCWSRGSIGFRCAQGSVLGVVNTAADINSWFKRNRFNITVIISFYFIRILSNIDERSINQNDQSHIAAFLRFSLFLIVIPRRDGTTPTGGATLRRCRRNFTPGGQFDLSMPP